MFETQKQDMAVKRNKPEAHKNTTVKEPYLKVLYSILNLRDLDPGEKLLLAHVYSFGAKGCWQSNETLASIFMASPRTISRWLRKIIAGGHVQLKSPKGYYRTIWARSHPDVQSAAQLYYRGKPIGRTNDGPSSTSPPGTDKNGQEHSQGWLCELDKNGFRHGQICPATNNTTIKETIVETIAPPSPLPAGGQAPAVLTERRDANLRRIAQFKQQFGLDKKPYQPLSEAQFGERRQKQRLALLAP
ncbi:MAG: hypothetical protein A2Z25_03330 [Planctomycetes bacterium RBG_16_55_9]|nr:MAG: hypothetical protein A2Z25_03330 [Planctomycetes bacterium RBG_16_55_9]